MKTATITQTKNQLSAFIEVVKHGESVLILDRSVPVARLEPVGHASRLPGNEALSQLERRGIVRRGTAKLRPGFVKERPPKPARPGASIVDAVRRDREEGR